MKKIISIILMALLIPSVNAETTWTEYCCNSSYYCKNATINIDNEVIFFHVPVKCQYGCNDATPGCVAVDITENSMWWAFGMIMIGIGIYLAYIAYVERTTRGETIYDTEGEE